jgi:hypothetical protein
MGLDPDLADVLAPDETEDEGSSVFGQWWFWTAIGAVVAASLIVVIAVSASGADPVQGNLSPGILEVEL